MASKKVLKALSPPADAPMPTTRGEDADRSGERGFVLRWVVCATAALPAFFGGAAFLCFLLATARLSLVRRRRKALLANAYVL
jgi:hypothetical protein